MKINDILNTFRNFELNVGESFFSCIDNVIDVEDFLTWLDIHYPNIYKKAEKNFYNIWPADGIPSFKSDFGKGNVFDLEMILDAISQFYYNYFDDSCTITKHIYTIVAEYILDKNLMNKIDIAIKQYYDDI